MTWPFENDTSMAVKTFAVRSLKANRSLFLQTVSCASLVCLILFAYAFGLLRICANLLLKQSVQNQL